MKRQQVLHAYSIPYDALCYALQHGSADAPPCSYATANNGEANEEEPAQYVVELSEAEVSALSQVYGYTASSSSSSTLHEGLTPEQLSALQEGSYATSSIDLRHSCNKQLSASSASTNTEPEYSREDDEEDASTEGSLDFNDDSDEEEEEEENESKNSGKENNDGNETIVESFRVCLPRELTARTEQKTFRWNETYQALLQRMSSHQHNESEALLELHTLYKDFMRTAKLLAITIVDQHFLPVQKRTHKPADTGGIAGGDKYMVQGIFFKFAIDSHSIYGGTSNAAKAAKHELRNVSTMLSLYYPNLFFPLLVVLDYRGFRISAMSLLPINKNTLLYGSSDGGLNVKQDSKVHHILRKMAKQLNLKKHVCGLPGDSKEMYTPLDLEVHKGQDDRLYVIDCHRLFPPEAPLPLLKAFTNNTISKDEKECKASTFLTRLLRPEFVRSYSPAPLCNDAFSNFIMFDPDRAAHNQQAIQATLHLMRHRVREFAKWLVTQHGCVSRRQQKLANMRGTGRGCYIELDTKAGEDDNLTDLLSLPKLMHKWGINVRHLGLLFEELFQLLTTKKDEEEQEGDDKQQNKKEQNRRPPFLLLSDLFPSSLEEEADDEEEEEEQEAEEETIHYWLQRTLTEMVLRVSKETFRALMRREMQLQQTDKAEPFHLVALRWMNLLFGTSHASQRYWREELVESVCRSFYYMFDWRYLLRLASSSSAQEPQQQQDETEEKETQKPKKVEEKLGIRTYLMEMKQRVNMRILFRELMRKTGIRVRDVDPKSGLFTRGETVAQRLNRQQPFSEQDIVALEPVLCTVETVRLAKLHNLVSKYLAMHRRHELPSLTLIHHVLYRLEEGLLWMLDRCFTNNNNHNEKKREDIVVAEDEVVRQACLICRLLFEVTCALENFMFADDSVLERHPREVKQPYWDFQDDYYQGEFKLLRALPLAALFHILQNCTFTARSSFFHFLEEEWYKGYRRRGETALAYLSRALLVFFYQKKKAEQRKRKKNEDEKNAEQEKEEEVAIRRLKETQEPQLRGGTSDAFFTWMKEKLDLKLEETL
ncbi:Clu domain-containing protein [Balamuthia mandrillaris]